MNRYRKARRWLVRLLPPVLLILALTPAAARAEKPTKGDAYHCFDLLADKKVQAIPAPDLVTDRISGARLSTRLGVRYRWGVIWREYVIAGALYNQEQQARAWIDQGTIWCEAMLPVITGMGPNRLNPRWLG